MLPAPISMPESNSLLSTMAFLRSQAWPPAGKISDAAVHLPDDKSTLRSRE